MLRYEKSIALKAQKPLIRTHTKPFKIEDLEKNPMMKKNQMKKRKKMNYRSSPRKSTPSGRRKKNTLFRGKHIASASRQELKDKRKDRPVVCYGCKKAKACVIKIS